MSDSTCAVETCDSPPTGSRGWCWMHYTRWQRHGHPLALVKEKGVSVDACSIEGCERPGPYSRAMCKKHYTSFTRNGDPLAARTIQSRKGCCDVEGCTKPIKGNRLCAMHKARLENHGTFDAPIRNARQINSRGYAKVKVADGHPLADRHGWAYEHRVVLFDKVGYGAQVCHWCGAGIRWDAPIGSVERLTADHLDWDKLNNDPDNIVPSCLPCNSKRLQA